MIKLIKFTFCLLFYFISADVKALTESYTLTELINLSINNHPSVSAQKMSISASEMDKTAAKLSFFPSFAYVKSNTGGGGTSIAVPGSSFVSANLPIFTGGASMYGLMKADKLIEKSKLEFDESVKQISEKTISVYVEWLKSKEKQRLLNAHLNELEKIIQIIRRRVEAGVSPKSDLEIIILRRNQLELEAESIQNNINISLHSIEKLIGKKIKSENINSNEKPIVFKGKDLLNLAIENINRKKIYDVESKIIQLDGKISRAQSLPQIFFTAQQQLSNTSVYNTPLQNFYGITIQFSTSQGFSRYVYSSAEIKRGEAKKIENDGRIIDLELEIIKDFNEMNLFNSKISNLLVSEKIQKNILESTKLQYQIGKKNIIDIINSTRDYYNFLSQISDTETTLINLSWKFLIRISKSDTQELIESKK